MNLLVSILKTIYNFPFNHPWVSIGTLIGCGLLYLLIKYGHQVQTTLEDDSLEDDKNDYETIIVQVVCVVNGYDGVALKVTEKSTDSRITPNIYLLYASSDSFDPKDLAELSILRKGDVVKIEYFIPCKENIDFFASRTILEIADWSVLELFPET